MSTDIVSLNQVFFGKATVSVSTFSASQTTLSLQQNHGARCGTPPFRFVLYNSTDYVDAADAYWSGNAEVAECTARSSDTLTTIERGLEGTAGIAGLSNKTYKIIVVPTLAVFQLAFPKLGAVTGATPSVSGLRIVTITQSGATSVTNFTNPVAYQRITVIAGDANTTITNNDSSGGIKTKSGSNISMGTRSTAEFIYNQAATRWCEV